MITEEKARAYAEKELVRTISRPAHPLDYLAPYFDSKDIQQAYLTGATEALSHQWISVDERLPEYNTTCLVFGHETDFGDGRLVRYTMMAHYDGENFYDAYNDSKYHPEMWMPIPAIPQSNPEKQSI